MTAPTLTCDRPLAIDLFCGLGGWTEGLLAATFRPTVLMEAAE